MTLVKILRDSIKLNPNYGQTFQKVPTELIATFDIFGKVPEIIENDSNFVVSSFEVLGEEYGDTVTKGFIMNPTELGHNYPSNVSINIEQKYETISHIFSPKYSYKYDWENFKQNCNICDKTFTNIEIEEYSLAMYDDCEPYYCPNCNNYDSFDDIEYENIDDVLKEMNLN